MPTLHSRYLTKIDQLVAVGIKKKKIYIYIYNKLIKLCLDYFGIFAYLLGYILPMLSIKDSCSAHLGISGHILPWEIPWTEGSDRL